MKPTPQLRSFLLGCSLLAAVSTANVHAQTWVGGTSDWGTAGNWDPSGVPATSGNVIFTSTGAGSVYLGTAARTVSTITFNNTTTATPYTIYLRESSADSTHRILTVGNMTVAAGNHTILGSGTTAELTFSNGSTIAVAADSTLSLNAKLRGSGLFKTGDGTLALTRDNGGSGSWGAGTFTVSAGTLDLAANRASGNSANNFSVSSGATLKLSHITAWVSTAVGDLTLNGTGFSGVGALYASVTSSVTTSTFVNLATNSRIGVEAGQTLTIGGNITGAGLEKSGDGILSLTGTNNTYSGGTTVSAGTLALGHATNTLADTGVVNVSGGTLAIGANSDTVGAVTLTSGSITGTTGVLTGSSYAAEAGTISAILGGSAALAKTGSGTLTLSGDNTFSGGITSSGTGTLALAHSNAAGTGTIEFASTQSGTNATFTLSGDINVANDIVMDSSTGRNTINSLVGNNTLSGNITIDNMGGNQIAFQNRAGNGTTFTIGGATPNSTTITAATFANNLSFRAITGNTTALGVLNSRINAPNATFNINNDGFWTINSTANTWAATTLSAGNNRIKLGANDALATGARLDMGSATSVGFVDLNGFNQTVAGLAGTTTSAQIKNDSTADSTLTLAGLTANRSFSGAITDGSSGRTTSLVMDSSGRTQSLTGTSTFTGDTTISAGTLLITGSLGNSAVSVSGSSATIGGTGTINGSLTVAANSFLQVVDFDNPLAVGGTITFGSGFGITNLLGISWDDLNFDTPYTVLSTSQTFVESDIANFGFDNRVAVGSLGREAYFTNGSLAVIVIPEPRAALLGGLGLLMLLRRRRG